MQTHVPPAGLGPAFADGGVLLQVCLAAFPEGALPDPGAAPKIWLHLLKAGGMLLLVEGRWATGGGLTSAEVCAYLRTQGQEPSVTRLDDPQLWGRSIDDDRYLVVSCSTPQRAE